MSLSERVVEKPNESDWESGRKGDRHMRNEMENGRTGASRAEE